MVVYNVGMQSRIPYIAPLRGLSWHYHSRTTNYVRPRSTLFKNKIKCFLIINTNINCNVARHVQEIAGGDGHVGVVRCHLELKTQRDEPAGGKLPLVQKQTSTEPVFYNLSVPSTKEVLEVDVFQG